MKVLDYTGTNHLVSKTKTELAKKVDKVVGKGLSTNDYTNADKAEVAKVEGIEEDIDSLDLTKADKTKLASTDRRLDALYELTQGQAWDFDRDDNNTYEVTVPSGAKLATVQKYGGRSVVFNQLMNIADTSGTYNGVSYSVANGILTKSGTATGSGDKTIGSVEIISGHKYLKPYVGVALWRSGSSWSDIDNDGKYVISTANFSGSTYVQITTTNGTTYSNTVSLMCIDLTQMFGSGNEPTTVEEVKALLPNDYYEYNTGEVIHADVQSVDVVGKNLFDKDNINGLNFELDNEGHCVASSIRRCFYIPCKPNTTYTSSFKSGETFSYARNLIGYIDHIPQIGDVVSGVQYLVKDPRTITTNDTAKYLVCACSLDGYSNAEFYQIEEGSTATPYSSYRHNEYPIPQAIRNLEGYGWSAGSVYNEVDFERKKFIKRIKAIPDMSQLNWHVYNHKFYITVNDIKIYGTSGLPSTIISDKYPTMTTGGSDTHDYGIWQQYGGNSIFVGDTSFNDDVDLFKQSLQNCKLYYELAEPVEIDISDILEPFNVEAGGTITFHNSSGDGYRLPVPSTEEYTVKLSEVVSNG